jgi:hypothetical protein
MLMITNRGPAIVVIILWFWGGGNQCFPFLQDLAYAKYECKPLVLNMNHATM